MNRIPQYILFSILFTGGLAQAQILPNLGGQRAGISALTFLKNDVSPRSIALGGANLTLSTDGMAAFHNPALMSQNEMGITSVCPVLDTIPARLHEYVLAETLISIDVLPIAARETPISRLPAVEHESFLH